MEIAQAVTLTLPCRYGGKGLPLGKCNYRIELNGYGKNFTSKEYFVADLCWPDKKVIVEYDSDMFHANPAGIANDTKRRNALMAMGYTVIGITREQFMNPAEMDRVAALIAKKLGVRINPRGKDYFSKQYLLRKKVLQWLASTRQHH